jgi:hypothetical protein
VREGGLILEDLINKQISEFAANYINIIGGLRLLFVNYSRDVIRNNNKVMTHLSIVPQNIVYEKIGDSYNFKLISNNNIKCDDLFFADADKNRINYNLIATYKIHLPNPTYNSNISPLFDFASIAVFCLIPPGKNTVNFFEWELLLGDAINSYAMGTSILPHLSTLRSGLIKYAMAASPGLVSMPKFNETIGIQLAMFNYLVSYKYFYETTTIANKFRTNNFDYKIYTAAGTYESFEINSQKRYRDLINFIQIKINEMISYFAQGNSI